MPVIAQSVSVPANGVVDNALQGSQYEFLPFNALLEFGIVQQSATAGAILHDVYSGSDTLVENGAVSNGNRFPIYPDDYSLTDVAAAGERIKVRLRNTTALAISVWVVCRITPA